MSEKNKTAPEYSYPDCKVSGGISAYVKVCKSVGIPSGPAVRNYRETLKKGRKAVLRLVDSAEEPGPITGTPSESQSASSTRRNAMPHENKRPPFTPQPEVYDLRELVK